MPSCTMSRVIEAASTSLLPSTTLKLKGTGLAIESPGDGVKSNRNGNATMLTLPPSALAAGTMKMGAAGLSKAGAADRVASQGSAASAG
jgi:hypothetical protein